MKTFSFFEKEIEQAKVIHDAQRKAKPSSYLYDVEQCNACGLDKKVRSPRMWYTGEGRQRILVIGEANGGKEDAYGKQFHEQGDAGAKLRTWIETVGR
jgi:uracil-DNA glycosylase